MEYTEFLENYPLYRNFEINLEETSLNKFPKVNINMYCPECKDVRTFKHIYIYENHNDFNDHAQFMHYKLNYSLIGGMILNVNFLCASCEDYQMNFSIRVGDDLKSIRKVGQYPPYSIAIEKELNEVLDEYAPIYKKGLINESQSYGIGAFAYYRRIVEDIINKLLSYIPDLMSDEDKEKYSKAFEKAIETKVTEKKIDIIKDLLPPILTPHGQNPLKVLHKILSEGIHGKSDEKCLEDAAVIREILTFVVKQVMLSRKESLEITDKIKKLIQKES